jgi:glycosyltransferase involved in cell wall biosynthesis
VNILLLATVDYPQGDAPSARASILAKGLRTNGDSAFLVIPHGSKIGNVAGNTRLKGHAYGVPYCYTNGTTGRAHGSLGALAETMRGMFAACALIRRRRIRHKLDAVILYSPDALEYLLVIITCKVLGVPLIIEICEMMTTSIDRRNWRQRLRLIGYSLTERVLPRLTAGYIVISTSLQQHYAQYLRYERIILIPILVVPKVAPNVQVEGMYRKETVLLYSGSFGEKDGFEYLLKAFKQISAAHPEAKFVTTGKGPAALMAGYEAKTKELGIQSRVEFRGFLSRAELDGLQQRADVLLACRTNSEFARHGFPWKLGEYCLTAKPIVATRVGDIEKYFQNGVSMLLAEPENVASIAAKIAFVLDNPEDAGLIAECGKAVALNQFGYVKETARLAEFVRGRIVNTQ